MEWRDPLDRTSWINEGGITTITCRSLAEFMAVHAQHFATSRNLIFRGQADYDWALESSLRRLMRARLASTGDGTIPFNIRAEAEFPSAFTEFLERLHVVGDMETRDMIKRYRELWYQSQDASIDLEFKALVALNEIPLEHRRMRADLRMVEFQLLAIAQHYGMPTPLIDWSQSPFVAWYFALREPTGALPTVLSIAPGVWATVSHQWLRDRADKIRQEIDEVRRVRPQLHGELPQAQPTISEQRSEIFKQFVDLSLTDVASFQQYPASSHVNERLQAQQGVLTRHSVGYSLEEIANIFHSEVASVKSSLIWKFVLLDEPREKAMIQLRMMNITGSTLFPGLVGAGQVGLDSLRFDYYSAKVDWHFPYGFA